jgi:hypothetical protein
MGLLWLFLVPYFSYPVFVHTRYATGLVGWCFRLLSFPLKPAICLLAWLAFYWLALYLLFLWESCEVLKTKRAGRQRGWDNGGLVGG